MINFAHRGSSSDFPENTMLAFKKAITQGANGIELDVHKTRDNKLVVIHDEDVERTFIGKGLVKNYSLKELKNLKCRKEVFQENIYCNIPTLEEVIELISPYDIILNIELKTDEIYYENIESDVINLINKYNIKHKIIISSFNKKSLIKSREIDRFVKLGYLVDNNLEGAMEFMENYNINFIHPNFKLLSDEIISEFKEKGKRINTYTVDSPKYMRLLSKSGVEGIITNTPSMLREIYSEINL